MNPTVEAALIASAISVVVALIGYLAARSKIRSELQAIKLQQKHSFVEKLLEIRLEAYPDVFDITQNIGKRSNYTDEEIIQITNEALEKLDAWQRKKSGLLLSRKSLSSYYELRDALRKNPANKGAYTNVQLEKIWFARNSFRGCLRDDVGLLHDD